MWAALENAGVRISLPVPLVHGDRVKGIFVDGQTGQGRHTIRLRGRRHSQVFQLKQFYSLDIDAFLRWQNEARLIGLAPQPGFVWPCEEWRGGLVTPMPCGLRLGGWLKRKKPDMDARLGAGAALARALVRLHGMGIAHRGLTPMTVLVNGAGNVGGMNATSTLGETGNGTARGVAAQDEHSGSRPGQDMGVTLMDFGCALIEGRDDLWADTALSATHLGYASTQRLDCEDVGYGEDVYGFGALLHLLLSGRPPFGFAPRLLRYLAPYRITPRRLPRSCAAPGGVQPLAAACMEHDPANRPTLAEATAAMAAYGGGAENAPFASGEGIKQSDPIHGRSHVMVFIKDDTRAHRLFDAVLDTAQREPSAFLFVGMIPATLTSGHTQRFTGGLFRKLAQGLLRCRKAGIPWSLRLMPHPDPPQAARHFIQIYAPDRIYLGETESDRTPLALHDSFLKGLGPLGEGARSFS